MEKNGKANLHLEGLGKTKSKDYNKGEIQAIYEEKFKI